MNRARGAAISFVALMGTNLAFGEQTPSSDTARKHLESGIQFYEQAQYKQALNDFEIVVSMSDSDYADDALLKIGEYYLEIEEDFDKAQGYFDEVLQNYPTKDAAPGAYYYIGLLAMRSSIGAQSMDDAIANFQRVVRLYPQSSWVPAALYATGAALERRGAWDEALDPYFKVISEFPESRWAAGAQMALGRCTVSLGDPMQGMAEIQRVRDRYPGTREAEDALDWLTHLYRLYGYPRLGRPVSFRADSSFRLATAEKFKNVEAVKISTAGIHVLERGRKRILTFAPSGQLKTTKAAADPQGLFVDPRGTLVIANEKGLLIGELPLVLAVPEEKGPKPLDKIRAVARNQLGDIFVYDDRQKKVLRFNPDAKLISPFPDSTPREVMRLELDTRGNLILLEKNNRSVTVYSPTGRRLTRIERRGERWNLKKPSDIAVDPAGYLYVLDADQPQLVVFNPSYQFVTLLSAGSLGGGVLKKPVALDVDSSGDIYVYDDGSNALVRFH